jgi:hypothetical protein
MCTEELRRAMKTPVGIADVQVEFPISTYVCNSEALLLETTCLVTCCISNDNSISPFSFYQKMEKASL